MGSSEDRDRERKAQEEFSIRLWRDAGSLAGNVQNSTHQWVWLSEYVGASHHWVFAFESWYGVRLLEICNATQEINPKGWHELTWRREIYQEVKIPHQKTCWHQRWQRGLWSQRRYVEHLKRCNGRWVGWG